MWHLRHNPTNVVHPVSRNEYPRYGYKTVTFGNFTFQDKRPPWATVDLTRSQLGPDKHCKTTEHGSYLLPLKTQFHKLDRRAMQIYAHVLYAAL